MTRLLASLTLALALSFFAARGEAQCTPEAPCVLTLRGPDAPAPAQPTLVRVQPQAEQGLIAPRTRPRWGLAIGGGVMTLVAYGVNIGGSAIWYTTSIFTGQRDDYFHWSLVPVVGPFVQMGFVQGQDWQIPILAVVGAAQIAGVVMAIVGTVSREVVEPPALAVAPYATQDGGGLTVAGAW